VNRFAAAFGGWLETEDPGAVRRRRGARAALATLCAWLTLRAITGIVADPPPLTVAFYGVVACFVCSLAIADPRRRDRIVALAGSAVALGFAAALAAGAGRPSGVSALVLLGLVFLTFAARRRSLLTAELALVATMGVYFADVSDVRVVDVPWFAAAAAIGVGWVAAWQLLLLPYDPAAAIVAAGRAFAHRAADLVVAVEQVLGGPATDAASAGPAASGAPLPKLERRMVQVRASRLVIESQFPGALAPRSWTRDRLQLLQVAFYEAELGLRLLVDACGDPDALAAIPADIRGELRRLLDALQDSLRSVSDEASMRRLEQRSDELRDGAREHARGAAVSREPGDPPPSWVEAAIRLARGSRQVARAIATVQGLQAPQRDAAAGSAADIAADTAATASAEGVRGAAEGSRGTAAAGAAAPPAAIPAPRGPLGLHPTTVLGIQAVVATGAAMLVAQVVDPGHANWVFWTAFVVIAGSSGETLRRIVMRIAGTLAGVVLGVGLALVLPDEPALVIVVATAAVFLTIYWAPVSYAVMIMWLNAGFMLVAAQLGARELDLLVARPTAVLLGAAIAAVVALTVLPMPLVARYRAALVGFLGAVDAALHGLLPDAEAPDGAAGVGGAGAGANVTAGARAVAGVDAAYRRVEAVLPGVAFEGNLMASARTPLAGKGGEVGAVAAAVARLARAVDAEREEGRDPAGPVVVAVAGRIRANITAIVSGASGTGARFAPSLSDLLAPEAAASAVARFTNRESPPSGAEGAPTANAGFADGILSTLVEIHAGIVELAGGLGVTAAPAIKAATEPPKEPS
jgi:hypothetical protein